MESTYFANAQLGVPNMYGDAKAVKQTSVTHATETLSRVRELALRLESLAEAICGAAPIGLEGSKGLPVAQPSGILPALQCASEEANSYIVRANQAIDRINSFI